VKKRIKRCFVLFLFLSVILGEALYQYRLYASERLPMDGRMVVIDPGHGGWDPGKAGNGGDDEKNINLVISENLKFLLELGGAQVVMTRYDDEALDKSKTEDMKKRKRIIGENDADIMISIHQNSFPSPAVKGAQTFYYKNSEEGKLLAQCIQKALVEKADKENTRQAKENSNYYVLKNTSVPSVIVECGFLSNEEEEAKLNSNEYQQMIAWGIYSGIADYFAVDG